MSELRKGIDAVRAAAGLPAAWSNYDPVTGEVAAAHFTELRTKLNEARAMLSLPDVTFTDAVSAGAVIRRSTVTELRNGVK